MEKGPHQETWWGGGGAKILEAQVGEPKKWVWGGSINILDVSRRRP